MKRYDENLEVTVFKYDLFPPADWGVDCEEEIKKMDAMWNALVKIERDHVAAVRAVAAPAVELLDKEAADLEDGITTLVAQRKALRKASRTKIATPELDEKIDEAKSWLRAYRIRTKELRQKAYEQNKDTLKELDRQRYAKIKETYQNSGLFWPNYNAVIAAYDRSRGRVLKSGRELHERPYNGEGRFTNQIQGGMTLGRLLSDTHSQVGISAKPEWMRNKHGATLRFCIYNRDGVRRVLNFPFIMYRDMPEDALIKEVVVTRRRFANRWSYAVVFTLTRLRPDMPAPTGLPVAINLGWRKLEASGALRVATAVRTAATVNDTETNTTCIEGDLMAGFEAYAAMQSARDNARNKIVAVIKSIRREDWPVELVEHFERVHADRPRIGHVIALYEKWSGACSNWNVVVLTELAHWWRGAGRDNSGKWRKLIYDPAERLVLFGEHYALREQAYRRRWLTARRLYFYRLEARRLVGDAALVVINEHNMSDTARRDSNQPPPARRNRVIAAPSILRQAIVNYCKRYGIEVQVYKGDGKHHYLCGTEFQTQFPEELRQLCPACHKIEDIDYNYCRVMLSSIGNTQERRAA